MKNTWKRTIAILLSVLLVFTALPMALAATVEASGTDGAITWSLDSEGVMTISGSGKMTDYTSASLVPWNSKAASIQKLEITGSVTSVGNYAFYGCANLEKVKIPNSVVTIGTSAFENCTKLPSVTLPSGLQEIGDNAFYGCTALNDVSITSTNCKIAGPNCFPQKTEIYGYPGSTAQTFATQNGRKFISLGDGSDNVSTDTPAASTGFDLSKILGSLSTYIQPLLNMFKGLISQLFAGAGSNAGDATSTTGSGTGTTATNNASTADAMSMLSSIFSSFMAFASKAMASISNSQASGDATSTTGTAGTTTTNNTGNLLSGIDFGSLLSGFTGLLGGLGNAATTTTAPAK